MPQPKWSQRSISSKPGAEFPPDKEQRYKLIVNIGCPFAARAATVRHLLGLDDAIPISYFAPAKGPSFPDAKEGEEGHGKTSWVFDQQQDPSDTLVSAKDPVFGAFSAEQIYTLAVKPEDDQKPMERFTVPILIDSKTKQVVSAESGDIVEFLWKECRDTMWSEEAKKYIDSNPIDLFPNVESSLGQEMKKALDKYQNGLTFGVYGVGFAESQEEYDAAIKSFYKNMDDLEQLLDTRRFLAGDTITFADLSLIQMLVRFDVAYFTAFRFNIKRVRDYKNVYSYMCDVVNLLKLHESAYVPKHIIGIYFGKKIDPSRKEKFVPDVPADVEFTKEKLTQHGRDTRKYSSS